MPSPASGTKAKTWWLFYVWNIGFKAMGTAQCGWAWHYSCLKTKSLYIKKAHKRQDLPGNNYIQQKLRWGRGYACTCVQGKQGEKGNGAVKKLKTHNKKILKNVVSTCSCNHVHGKCFLKSFLTALHYQCSTIKMRRVTWASNGVKYSKRVCVKMRHPMHLQTNLE